MEFKLIEEINKEEVNKKIYFNGYYYLTIEKNFSIDYTYLYINKTRDREYIPTLFLEKDLYTRTIENITIDVVGRGSLEVEEIEEIIKGYNIAIETVKELKELLKEYM